MVSQTEEELEEEWRRGWRSEELEWRGTVEWEGEWAESELARFWWPQVEWVRRRGTVEPEEEEEDEAGAAEALLLLLPWRAGIGSLDTHCWRTASRKREERRNALRRAGTRI